jgi:hypothetical protein
LHVVLDAAGDLLAGAVEVLGAGDVEEGFVDGQAFDVGRVAVEDGEDLGGDHFVAGHVGREEDGVGAALAGFAGGHGGMDAEDAGFVGRRGDDPTWSGGAPTTTGRPRYSGWSRCSTAA